MLVRSLMEGDTFKSTYRRSAEIASRLFRETMKKKRATAKELDDKVDAVLLLRLFLLLLETKILGTHTSTWIGEESRVGPDSSVTGSGSEEF